MTIEPGSDLCIPCAIAHGRGERDQPCLDLAWTGATAVMLPAVKRRVYRAWFQTIVLTAVMATFLLLSVAAFTSSDPSMRDPFGIVLYSVIGVGSLFGIWLAFRMGAVVDSHGIHIRSFGRGRFIPWRDVAALSCEASRDTLGFRLYAPALRLAAPSDPEDRVLLVTELASYRSMSVQRRIDALLAFVPSQPAAPRRAGPSTGHKPVP
jgi:hypothetical protein